MPLTPFQHELLVLLASSRNDERYLAGGAALHFAPNSARFSDDLDFFHDSAARVATSFAADRDLLERAGYTLEIEISLPGYLRAMVERAGQRSRIDWAHDSAWRFVPLVRDAEGGLLLQPVDLAINKLFALAGRDEPRDFLDIIFAHEEILPIPALIWGAAGKDPGLSPNAILELLRRRGRYRPEDFLRLQLSAPFDLQVARQQYLDALDDSERFIRSRPHGEYGCLYYSLAERRFVCPRDDASLEDQQVVPHFGSAGGVVPQIVQPLSGDD